MERAAGGSRKTPRALVTPAQPGAAQPGKNTSRALAGGSAVHAQGLPPARTQGGSSQSLAETLGEKPVVGGGQVKLQYRAGDAEPTAAALRVMDFPTRALDPDPRPGPRPAPWTRTRPCAPGPSGHPVPSGLSLGTRLGRAPEAGTAATRDFTPPSWDPAARYRQPCTSCLKTQERERAREIRVSAAGRKERRAAGSQDQGATACITAMVGTQRSPGRGDPAAPAARVVPRWRGLGPGPPCRWPRCQPPARSLTVLPFAAAAWVLPSPQGPRSRDSTLPPPVPRVVGLLFPLFFTSPNPHPYPQKIITSG